ncbi:uncharacterized protein G2W53_000610 [Senna tora]|uniref:Uncharacterized protein n=1 Tax=Senna tora TaxID=362788 RepID=A0A835CKR2_9FABA|nr:uncharacterized protein G2W53_000610 [Senna tora]
MNVGLEFVFLNGIIKYCIAYGIPNVTKAWWSARTRKVNWKSGKGETERA